MTRYLVTGGAGFIGSHLVESLINDGHHVAVLDNLSTGSAVNLRTVEGRIQFVHGSVLDPLLMDDLVSSVDVVVHLAASVGVRLVVERPLHSFITNIRGTEVMLDAAHRYRRKVLLASTSEVYGKTASVPFGEDDDRLLGSTKVTRWGYSISKAVDEVLAFAYHRERGLPTIVARFFNTVGPRQSPAYGMVLPRFVTQAVAAEPITVYGDGLQSRCFCHVQDVIRALRLLLDDDRAHGEVFNVGSQEEISMIDLARLVAQVVGSPAGYRLVTYDEVFPEGFEDMRRRVPDISRIRDLTGWEPGYDLVGIIKELVAIAKDDALPVHDSSRVVGPETRYHPRA